MEIVNESAVESKEYRHPREGHVNLKILLTGEIPGGVSYSLARTDYGQEDDAFVAPRHRHTFEQIRFALDGALNYSKGKDIPEGWAAYFPEGAFYGPQRVSGGSVLLLQFGRTYLTEEQKRRAQEDLAETGTFESGMYVTVDAATGNRINTDGVQAIWEHVLGQKLRYPEPRYPEPILMNPDAFDWVETNADDIRKKTLGMFTEREVALHVVEWLGPNQYELGPDRTQIVYTLTGEVAADDHEAAPDTVVVCPEGETSFLVGSSSARALIVEMPRAERGRTEDASGE